ncbi:MAG: HNH endonuclease [Chloroflexota bacterium]
MARHYTLYWKLKAVEYRFYGEALDHLSHDQLRKVEPGDVVWVVTARGGDLFLVGRVAVGEVLDEAEADPVFDPYQMGNARWHVHTADGAAEPMQLVNLTALSVTMSLRFESSADRLRIDHRGRLNTISLYNVRQLTADSGSLLSYAWYTAKDGVDGVEQVDTEDDNYLIYAEGKASVQRRVVRQRSTGLVNAAKARFAEEHGELRCEICGMSFADVYGEIGTGYIEAHHPEPISEVEGEHFTDVDGIVLVCANCHRMVHRRTPPYSIDELRNIVTANRRNAET